MTPVPDPKTLKNLGLISYAAFLSTVLLTTTSYGEKSFITDVSTLQLALCSAASLTIPFVIFRRRKSLGRRECLTWIVLAVGCAVLAMDDKLMLHERLDQTIHAAYGWEETHISDKIDDIIVGLYGVIGIVFIAANRSFFSVFRKIHGIHKRLNRLGLHHGFMRYEVALRAQRDSEPSPNPSGRMVKNIWRSFASDWATLRPRRRYENTSKNPRRPSSTTIKIQY